ncbi:MAG: helix-turn-helix transcriptional regulator [Actinomycetota bacterium]|nr:helix-turn-helix transcriptional regulator [Actinomycetota bacterium]
MDLLEHGAVAAIRDLVEESGLRKSDVCRRSGVSRALLDDYLAGRKEPSLRQLKRVADALDLRLEIRIGPRVRPISDEYISAIRLAGTLARGRNSTGDQQLRFPDRVWARFRTATAQTQPPFLVPKG